MSTAAVETPLATARLRLRRPRASDARAILERYAADAEVTRYLSWPTHRNLEDTLGFIALSDAEWERTGAGPLLVERSADDCLVGSTGLDVEAPHHAATGYVFARDAWGRGYATEVLAAMCVLAESSGFSRLSAICHCDHAASARVLEKCGFLREGTLRAHTVFPNLGRAAPQDVSLYARTFSRGVTRADSGR